MRVSSSTLPSLIGTLKSTRMKTRRPLRSRSLIESFMPSNTTSFPADQQAQRFIDGGRFGKHAADIIVNRDMQDISIGLKPPSGTETINTHLVKMLFGAQRVD